MNPSSIDANESVAHRLSGPPRQIRLQHYGLAIFSVGVALGVSLLLGYFHFRVPFTFLMLFAVAISSWYGGRGPSVLAVVLSTISFYWYFVEPVRTIYIYRSDIPLFIIFAAFAALLSWFGTVRRRVEADLCEQADLLNLTHDTVFVMDMDGVIKYWNRAAQERYGWTAEQAVGRVVHDLLKTVFPAPLDEIKAEVTRTGRWEGELLQTRKDGSQLVAASRWSLERGKRGEPVAILETNNDITERKHAEETLRRLNRELRAISNCNQVLLRATDERSLLEEICRIVCEEAGYRMAWVGYAEHDEAKSVRPVAWTGAEEGYLASAGITWADTESGRGPTGEAIRSGNSCCVQNFAMDPRRAPWREGLLQRGFRSGIALPLKDENHKAFGSLTIHSAQPDAFTSEEIRLLEELAGDMAFGIVTLRSRAARKRAEEALRQSDAYMAEAQRLSHTGSFAFDVASNNYVYTSEECLRIFELDAQQSLPPREAVSRFIHTEDWVRVQEDFEKLLREKVDTPSEFRIVLASGATKHVQVIRHPVLNGAGEIIRIMGTAIDITDRKRAEEALRLANAYNRGLIEASLDPLVTIGPDGKITDVNAATEAATGRSRDELIGTDFCDYFTEPANARAGYEQVFREGLVRDYPLELRHRDGRVMSVSYNAAVYRDESGAVVGVFAAARDITERKRAEEALRRTAAYLAEAQRLTHTGSWALDGTGQQVYWSEEVFQIWGFDPQRGLPKRDQVVQRIHPEDLEKYWKYWRAVYSQIREKIGLGLEFRIVLPDGTVKHLHGVAHPILNDKGDVVEVVGVTVDVTERKRAEEALRESELRFRTFVDHAADALFVQDEERHKVLDVNRQACESLGYTREELIGMVPHDFDPGADAALLRWIQERLEAGEVSTFETRHRRKDGTVFPVEVRVRPFQHGGSRLHLALARDISERKRAEEQREKLRQLEADLAHINRVSMMGELTASIAHEVNQPLSGVVSNASACLRWLAGDAPNLEEAREAARRIVRDGKRAAEVVARVRALTKRAAAFREKLDLNETIREVLAIVGDEAKKNRVLIRTEFASDVFPVSGDRVQLQQVVLNLVMNGIEAMGSVLEQVRELAITTRNTDSDQVQVTVQDSGKGLDPDTMPKVFEPFYTTKPSGMGMGLSISRSILQAHGGQLWAAANDGPGTSFHFKLPRYEEESHAAA